MFYRFIIAVLVIILPISYISGQTDIKKLTISVTDTTLTEFQQAKDIFNWITTHIQFDAKSFQHHKYPQQTIEEFLKRKKGLCADYAGLLTAMCRSVNIEAYTIKGYIKGYGYNSNMPFLRANHAWNVIHADSLWIIADPTWGSGFLEEKPGFINKLLMNTLHFPVSKYNLFFHPMPDPAFFNANPDSLVKTHYPLDPKWLFCEKPVRFYYFETGQPPVDTLYPGYLASINESKRLDAAGFEKQQGIMGFVYNNHNYFDKASGYLAQAQNFNVERAVTKYNLGEFEDYLTDMISAGEWLNRHRVLTDSVYRQRLAQLSKINTLHKKLLQKISSKANSVIRSYKTSVKQLNRMNNALSKKQKNYYIKIEKAELKKLYPEKRMDSIRVYPSGLFELQQQVSLLQIDEPGLNMLNDSLYKYFDIQIVNDIKIDSQLVNYNHIFGILLKQLYSAVLARNEKVIKIYLDSINNQFQQLMNQFNRKAASKSEINAIVRQYFNESANLQRNLNQQIAVLKQIGKITGNADTSVDNHNKVIDRLISSYNKAIVMAEKMKAYNQEQLGVKHAEMTALKKHKKNIGKESKHFTAWYSAVYEWNKMKYASEKTIATEMIAMAVRYKKEAEMKIKSFKP